MNGAQRLAGGIGAAGLEHHVGGDQARADIDEGGAVQCIAGEGIRRLAGKPRVQFRPSVAQAVEFERGEVGIAGAQIADRHPIVAGGFFHRGVEVGQVAGGGGAC